MLRNISEHSPIIVTQIDGGDDVFQLSAELTSLAQEVQNLELLIHALHSGADSTRLITELGVGDELSILIGSDPLTLSLEELNNSLSETVADAKTKVKTKRWTLAKKVALAVLAVGGAAIACHVVRGKLASKSESPDDMVEVIFSSIISKDEMAHFPTPPTSDHASKMAGSASMRWVGEESEWHGGKSSLFNKKPEHADDGTVVQFKAKIPRSKIPTNNRLAIRSTLKELADKGELEYVGTKHEPMALNPTRHGYREG